MKKNSSKTISRSNKPTTVIVTQEKYEADLRRGLTDDETLKPGKYLVRRGRFFDNHPELNAMQRTSKTRVTMFLDQDVIEAFKQAAAVENALPYQTQINLALRRYLAGQTLSLSLSDTATIQTLARAIAQELQAAQPKRK